MRGVKIPACFLLLSYIGVRLTWELYSFPITMSPYYAVLNLSVLTPLLLILLFQFYTGFRDDALNWILAVLSIIYISTYLLLGVSLYPLLLTPRLQPKFLFIDVFTLSNVIFTLIYTLYILLHPSRVKTDPSTMGGVKGSKVPVKDFKKVSHESIYS